MVIKVRHITVLFLCFLILQGCSQPPKVEPTATVVPTQTPLSEPSVKITSVPDVKAAARAYLDGWKADDYEGMYQLLTSISKDAISQEKFLEHYKGVAEEAAIDVAPKGLDYEILTSLVLDPETAQVGYRVTMHSVLVGDITRETLMNLHLEQGAWRVKWDDTLVLPELKGGNRLGMDREGFVPARANIYDRNGKALVAQTDAIAVGLYPDQIDPEQGDSLFGVLTYLTGMRTEAIQALYANFPAGAGWYLALGEVASTKVGNRFNSIAGIPGLALQTYKARYYFDGGIAPHVVGYVRTIQPDEVDYYKRKGYLQDERVGGSGLEQWGEQYLAGKRGGALYVFNSQNQPVTRLAEQEAQPSAAIYTTLDKDYQEDAQNALRGFRAAAVVLERDTGKVLAIASSPSFDPNMFEPVNANSYSLLEALNNETGQPFLNRAASGQYPLGSVFKIITMAAALESGKYTPASAYECGYDFTELGGVTLHDWTWDHYQLDGVTMPSGHLTLREGLMRSCNPFFWHIGLDLYNQNLTKAVSDMARGFGLGSKTGLEGVNEESGQVPDPTSQLDATNLAIGQGDLMVTPLQVADFVAAIGNGGTLNVPQVIGRIAPPDSEPIYSFTVKTRGTLPIKPTTLKAIQDSMVGVIKNTKPRGTAYHVFMGTNIPIAGKTGTATSGSGLPHAWFAGYTFAEREDKPDIAVAVVVENIGEGSDYAAPIFRRLVELYFTGSPGKLYPWESTFYVTRTPTPLVTDTPTP